MKVPHEAPRTGGSHLRRVVAATLLMNFGMAGCSTPASRYPQFAASIDDTSELSVVVDVCVATDVKGDRDFIALDDNLPLAERISAHVHYELEKRGYRIDTNIVTSIGSAIDKNVEAQAIASISDDFEKIETTPLPHFLHAHKVTEADRRAVTGLFEALVQLHQSEIHEGYERFARGRRADEVCHQEYFQDGIGLVVLVIGRKKTHLKTFWPAYASAVASVGLSVAVGYPVGLPIGAMVPDTTRISVWAVDANNNEILWHDGVLIGTVSQEEIVQTLDHLLRRLPDRSGR